MVGINLLVNIKTSASMIMIKNMIHENLSNIINIGRNKLFIIKIIVFLGILLLSFLCSFAALYYFVYG